MRNLATLNDAVDHLEQLAAGKHPEGDAYLDSLKLKHGTPEEKAAQAQKSDDEAAARVRR